MKRILVLSPLIGLASLLSSCVVAPAPYGNEGPPPSGPGYAGGPDGPGYYESAPPPAIYGDPYFVYGGVYYYSFGGRYCYYEHGRRIFVSRLPHGGYLYHRGSQPSRSVMNRGPQPGSRQVASERSVSGSSYAARQTSTRGVTNNGAQRNEYRQTTERAPGANRSVSGRQEVRSQPNGRGQQQGAGHSQEGRSTGGGRNASSYEKNGGKAQQ